MRRPPPVSASSSFSDFARVAEPALFAPAADDDWLGISDVVDSTRAIAEGRYKAVNMAGAAFIVSAINAVGRANLDFIFAGDGAAYVVPSPSREACRAAAAATAGWVGRELGLELRVALVRIAEVRAAGHDVRIARFRASEIATFAMLSGGGMTWAEREMKAGRLRLAPDRDGSPDLSGLSCRWQPFSARNGIILSLIVAPEPGADPIEVGRLVSTLLATVDGASADGGRPLPSTAPRYRPSALGARIEARTAVGGRARLRQWACIAAAVMASGWSFTTGRRFGPFDPHHYWRIATQHSDFRKYGDGLMMTIDCSRETVLRLEALMRDGEARGLVRYGTHLQDAAQMTCFVPSPMSDDHVHFVDGAGGGYAAAAQAMRLRPA